MKDDAFEIVQFLAGIVAFGVAMYLIFLSGSDDFTLNPFVLMTMIAILVLLLYGPNELRELVSAWRGGNGSD